MAWSTSSHLSYKSRVPILSTCSQVSTGLGIARWERGRAVAVAKSDGPFILREPGPKNSAIRRPCACLDPRAHAFDAGKRSLDIPDGVAFMLGFAVEGAGGVRVDFRAFAWAMNPSDVEDRSPWRRVGSHWQE